MVPNPGFNPQPFDPNAAQGDPFAGMAGAPLMPGAPPMGAPPGSPGLYIPDAPPQYDPDTDPVAQKLQSQEPLDLTLDLGAEKEQELAHFLSRQIEEWDRAVSRRIANQDVWRKAFECMSPGTANRWQNSSDMPSALTRITCNSHITRLSQQINNATPPMTAKARKPEARDACPLIEDAMEAVLDQAEWNTISDDLHRELVVVGNVFVRTTYETETARVPKRLVEYDEETMGALAQAGVDLHEAAWHSVKRLKFAHVEETIYDGVRWKVIPFEDGVLWPVTCRDPEKAYGIGERMRICGADLLDGARAGYYREDAVDTLLQKPSDTEPQVRMFRKDEQGMMPDASGGHYYSPEERLYKEYEVYEMCVLWDADEDDRLEWVVVHYHKDTRSILGLKWLDYEHGRPYYMMQRYIKRTAELFGMGIPELIAAYQDGDTNVLNQLADHQDLANNIGGNFAYTGLSGYDPTTTILQLGRPLKFENLSDTEFKQLPPMPMPTEAYQMSARYKDIVDLLTATSNPTLGKTTDTSKTLGEVQLVTNAANQIFEYFAMGVALQHAKLWDEARWLTAQFGMQDENGEIIYRRTAAPDVTEFKGISPKMLTADVDLVPTGTTQLSDMGAKIQQATLVQTQLMQLLATVPQWLTFAPVVLLSFGQYMKSLAYPLREKLLALLEQTILPLMQQQQQMMMQQALMGQMGAEQPGGAPPGAMAPPPGDIAGPPAPIPGPPPLPPGATAATNALPAAGQPL